MKPIICPLDNQPCEMGCPDRYNRPAGGCHLTAAAEFGAQLIDLGGDTVVLVYTPDKPQKKAAASAANTDNGKEI